MLPEQAAEKQRKRTGGGLSVVSLFLTLPFDSAMVPNQFPATKRMIIGDDGVMREGGQ
jgi:hypothetical protein